MDVEGSLRHGHHLVVTAVELVGVVVIVVGVVWAALRFVIDGLRHRDAAVFTRIRLSLGRFLVLGLEFQLAADILRTALTPTFAQIGQLAGIATIRTVLNYVLAREIAQEQRQVGQPERAG
ncbi:Uncharacterized membrane protein [Micromonospora phaseoli]|uniref:Uncharacterized membrane protein n=1 Tax=Micromonospora phaseoli TaxID=1144548 RepID=A0A1H6Z2C8_9ACTN|nr:DUF1622 domain-containing protein [Micromonospora phaseoli]PZW00346.1 putative membrane protein [Micromonospora phaseoli]GIJ76824.1 membrane protein [Micromonospora phaseoli]SEJ43710.1 Uncharacterized membrane protein [Micromonospora phaseoli]